MQEENEIKSYFGLSTENLLQLLNHHKLMYHIAGIPSRKELNTFSELIQKKEKVKKIKNFKKNYLKHNYISSKNKKFFSLCNEKLFKAASIIKENEQKYNISKENFLKTAANMKETDEKLNLYERELLHIPAISYYIDNKTDNVHTDEVCEKDLNEMTIDEMIYTYWHQTDEPCSELEDKTYEKEFEYMSIVY